MANPLPESRFHGLAGFWPAGLLFDLRVPTVVCLPVLAGCVLLGVPDPHAAVLVLTYGLSLASYALFVRGKALGRFLGERVG
jgi:membrane protein DedA with SNARE-associated domain